MEPNVPVTPSSTLQPETNQSSNLSPKSNSKRPLILIGIILLLLVGVGGIFMGKSIFMPSNNQQITDNQISMTPSIPSTNTEAPAGTKFVYFERTLAKPPVDKATFAGVVYKDEFATYDMSTGTKKVFHEESVTEDNVDSYRLFDNQYLAVTSPKGNRVISLDGQSVPYPSDDYFSDTISPSENVRVKYQFKDSDVIFSVSNKQTGLRKVIEMKQDLFLVPSIAGWSKDENSVFFTLVQTHISDPTRSLYRLDIGKGEVGKFSRDNAILDVQSTFIDSNRDEIYFVAKNGLFLQKMDSTKATPIQLTNISPNGVVYIVFPDDYDKHAIAISSVKQVVIKDIDSGDEEVVAEAHSDGSVYPTSWQGDNLIYTLRKEGSTGNEKLYGYFINGYVYNVKSKKSTEFVNHKTDSMFTVGRFYFIDWLK